MNASAADQDAAVSRIATEMHTPDAVSPLGRPDIDYTCAQSPNKTLGEVIERHAR